MPDQDKPKTIRELAGYTERDESLIREGIERLSDALRIGEHLEQCGEPCVDRVNDIRTLLESLKTELRNLDKTF